MQVNAAVVVQPSVLLAFHQPVPGLIARLSLLPSQANGASTDGAGALS